jgi:hypothetical protein
MGYPFIGRGLRAADALDLPEQQAHHVRRQQERRRQAERQQRAAKRLLILHPADRRSDRHLCRCVLGGDRLCRGFRLGIG